MFDEWLLVEYAVGSIPVNPETVVEVVSKLADNARIIEPRAFTPWGEVQKSIDRKIAGIDFSGITKSAIDNDLGAI